MAGFHGNHPKIRLFENQHYFDCIFFIVYIERQMSYQIAALPEFYEMEFQNQLSWLPGCHGNQRLSQN